MVSSIQSSTAVVLFGQKVSDIQLANSVTEEAIKYIMRGVLTDAEFNFDFDYPDGFKIDGMTIMYGDVFLYVAPGGSEAEKVSNASQKNGFYRVVSPDQAAVPIKEVSNKRAGEIVTRKPHGLSTGDEIVVYDVEGMIGLNNRQYTVGATPSATKLIILDDVGAPIETTNYKQEGEGGSLQLAAGKRKLKKIDADKETKYSVDVGEFVRGYETPHLVTDEVGGQIVEEVIAYNNQFYYRSGLTIKTLDLYERFAENQVNWRAETAGGNDFISSKMYSADVVLAKIYGFSFNGVHFDLERPSIFLVHGDGNFLTDDDRDARSPISPAQSGVGAQEYQFGSEMRCWHYDKSDFSVRMDIHTGMFEQILLEAEIEFDDHGMYGGKVGGGKVGGGKVGGGKVGGGKVGGGKVGGGKVGGGKVGAG